MKRILAALALPLALAACTPQQQQQAADAILGARQACVAFAPVFQVAALVPDARVQSILGYVNGMCVPLATGTVPSTVDGNTAAWLGSLAGMIRMLVPE